MAHVSTCLSTIYIFGHFYLYIILNQSFFAFSNNIRESLIVDDMAFFFKKFRLHLLMDVESHLFTIFNF